MNATVFKYLRLKNPYLVFVNVAATKYNNVVNFWIEPSHTMEFNEIARPSFRLFKQTPSAGSAA